MLSLKQISFSSGKLKKKQHEVFKKLMASMIHLAHISPSSIPLLDEQKQTNKKKNKQNKSKKSQQNLKTKKMYSSLFPL